MVQLFITTERTTCALKQFISVFPFDIASSSGRKLSVELTYRRALDLSERGKARGRYKISMPIGSSDRRVEIPIEWQIGDASCVNKHFLAILKKHIL